MTALAPRMALCCAAALICLAMPASARPVAYADGWMFMQYNDGFENNVSLTYSPTATLGIGPLFSHYRDTDGEFAGLEVNWLAKRWNMKDSQGNFYFLSGIGAGIADGSDVRPAGFAGLEADWESRRYYLSYENRYTAAGEEVRQEFQQKARIGIAPYIAESGGLHSWLMLQAEHFPEDDRPWTITPLVRVFKGDYLAEAGMSNKGTVMFNLMIIY